MTTQEIVEFIEGAIATSAAHFTEDRQHRLFLKRRIHPKLGQTLSGVCMFLGANPSKADEVNNDLTVLKETNWAAMWGFEWMWKLNLHALVSTDPAGLDGHPDPIGPFNDLWITECAARADKVVCAYGDLGKRDNRGHEVEAKLIAAGVEDKLYCFGLTKASYPKHTSRIAYSTPLVPYRFGAK